MHNPTPVLESNTHKFLWDFNIQTDNQVPARIPELIIISNKKRRIFKIVDFAVPADHRINLKECERKDKYLDLARELKKLWNMKVTIVPIVIGAFGTITKWLLKGLADLEVGVRVENIQMTALLRLEETCCHSNPSEKPSTNTELKNTKRVNNNNNNNKSSKKFVNQIYQQRKGTREKNNTFFTVIF